MLRIRLSPLDSDVNSASVFLWTDGALRPGGMPPGAQEPRAPEKSLGLGSWPPGVRLGPSAREQRRRGDAGVGLR